MKQKFKAFASIMLLLTMGICQMWATDYTIYQATSDGVACSNATETGISVTFNSMKGISNSPITSVENTTYGIAAGLKAPRWGGGGDGKNIAIVVAENYTATVTAYVQVNTASQTVTVKQTTESGTNVTSVSCSAVETVYQVQATDLAAGTYYIKATDKVGLIKLVASVTAAGGGGDVTAPTLSSSVPANSATDVAVSGTIVLTFSEAIANVDGSKFTLTGATKGTVAIDGTDSKKVNVPYSGAANSATVTLSVAAAAVADAAGNKSAALSNISFTTIAPTTYYTVTLNPAGGTISDATGWTLKGGNYEKEVASGTELTLPTFTKANRTFKTWRNAVPSDVTSPITVSADVSLTAVWCATIENVIYSWEGAKDGATEVGGTVAGSADNLVNQASAGYYCLKIDGKADWSTNHVDITLAGTEKVKTGDLIKYWGFYNKNSSANARPKMRDGNSPNAAIFDDGTNLPNLYDGTGSPAERTFTVPADINTGKVQITRSQTGSNTWINKLQIIRPTLIEESNVCAVTFNMHGHGDAVAQQDIVKGGKVTEPATASISGWVFGGWYKESTFDNAWVFASDVVNADTELHAKWTATASDDATLSDLKVGGTTIAGFDASTTEYYYEMPYGTAKADLPLITVTVHEEHATATIQNAKDRPDDTRATIAVTAEDKTTIKHYYVYFYNAPKLGVELIKATHKNATEATITGYIGGTADKNTQGGGKLGSDGHYFGIQLASGKFQSGDLLVIKASALNGGNTATLFTDKGETALTSGDFDVASKMFTYTLTKEVSKIYLYRTSSSCNPNVEYIAVYRSMDPFITSFKFGDDAATINESAKTISIELPYSTDVTALTPTLEVNGNGGATYTPTGAQNFSSPVNYVVTDAYDELSTTYAVTVNLATPSDNAYLASLSVAGYTLSFDKETTTYNIVLDYGTTALPEITYEVEDTGLAEAVKVEGGVNGATTITVTPEAGTGHEKVYTINFSVNTSPKFVVFDGQTMTAAVIEGSDATSGFSWTHNSASSDATANSATINGRAYTKSVKILGSATNKKDNKRYLTFTVPADYLAKFYIAGSTNSGSGEASLFISEEITSDPTDAIACVTAAAASPTWAQSRLQLPGTYYFCVSGSARIYELSIQLYPIDYSRDLTPGMLSTTCLPNGGIIAGASIFEIAYMDYDGTTPHKIYFDEVDDGVMEAGVPYIVLTNEGSTGMSVFYTDSENKTEGLNRNGLVGYIGERRQLVENDYFIYNNMFYVVSASDNRVHITSNRAYINLSDVPGYNNESISTPAPGRRRMSIGNGSAPTVPTAVDNAQADNIQCTKVLIDGRLFIIRGEKMYDATGRLVK